MVETAPRQRWDREMGGEIEGELNPGKGTSDFAFDLLRVMTHSGRHSKENPPSKRKSVPLRTGA